MADYTPMAGGAIIAQMRQKNVLSRVMAGVLAFNTLLQLVAACAGGMIVFDASCTTTVWGRCTASISSCALRSSRW